MDETDNILGKSNDSKQDDVCCSDWMVSYQNEGFSKQTLQLLDQYVNNILHGRTNLSRFNLQEHAGLCSADSTLIGAYTVASYARASLATSSHASTSQGSPANWEIDEMVAKLGFHDNNDGRGVNYIGDRLILEDMHPANVFIDKELGHPICIDCIVKFK